MSAHSVLALSVLSLEQGKDPLEKIRCDWLVEGNIIQHLCAGEREILHFLDH